MTAVTAHSDFGAQEDSLSWFSLFPHLFCMKWWDWMLWSSFIECCFKPAFSLSSFIFIKRHFSYSLIFAIRVISSAYVKILIFLLAILIPACALSSLVFHMMYSAYKLNKQGDNIQPWCPLFPDLNQSVVPCPVVTVASWPAYRFCRWQVRWSGILTSLRIFYSLLWSTQSKALVYSIKQMFSGILLHFL